MSQHTVYQSSRKEPKCASSAGSTRFSLIASTRHLVGGCHPDRCPNQRLRNSCQAKRSLRSFLAVGIPGGAELGKSKRQMMRTLLQSFSKVSFWTIPIVRASLGNPNIALLSGYRSVGRAPSIQKALVSKPSTAGISVHFYSLSTHGVEAGEVDVEETLFFLIKAWVEEMAQELGALGDFPEAQGSIPTLHMVTHSHL